MALDYRERVKKLAVLDIVPTRRLYADSTREFATAYFWWFFLIQAAPLPETLIGNSVEFWLSEKLGKDAPGAITSAAFARRSGHRSPGRMPAADALGRTRTISPRKFPNSSRRNSETSLVRWCDGATCDGASEGATCEVRESTCRPLTIG